MVSLEDVKLVGYGNRKGWLLYLMQKRKMKMKRKARNLEIYEERNCLFEENGRMFLETEKWKK